MDIIHSIWDYQAILESNLAKENQVSLGEGHTELVKVGDLNLKLENNNPTGSVKDRGIAYQVSVLKAQGASHFVLPSSGNGAISAAKYCEKVGVKFSAIVSLSIDESKLAALRQTQAEIIKDSQPTKFAHRFAVEHQAVNLRPSIDEMGSIGYRTIACELYEQLGRTPGAIFFPVSSGTTMAGVYDGFDLLNQGKPRLYAVQTSTVHPIAGRFESGVREENQSLATGIVARAVPRRSQILEIISETVGSGVVVDNAQIMLAYNWLHENGINASFDGAVSVAGAWEQMARESIEGEVVCLITGKQRDL